MIVELKVILLSYFHRPDFRKLRSICLKTKLMSVFLSFLFGIETEPNYINREMLPCSESSVYICDPSRQKGHVVGKHCFEI